MKYTSRRELRKKRFREKYVQIYKDLSGGRSWEWVADEYGYKNKHSLQVSYYKNMVKNFKKNI